MRTPYTKRVMIAGIALLLCAGLTGCAQRTAADEKALYPYEEQQDPFIVHEDIGSGDEMY